MRTLSSTNVSLSSKHVAAVLRLAVAAAAVWVAPAQADTFDFDQISKFDNNVDLDQFSLTGQMEVNYTAPAGVEFMNVVSNGSWIVQNLPLIPGQSHATYDFNLNQLGDSDGVDDNATHGYFSTRTA